MKSKRPFRPAIYPALFLAGAVWLGLGLALITSGLWNNLAVMLVAVPFFTLLYYLVAIRR